MLVNGFGTGWSCRNDLATGNLVLENAGLTKRFLQIRCFSSLNNYKYCYY